MLESSALRPPAPALNDRRALAHWIANADNPLTARIMVNRLWQHHFGQGLVATPSDFGTRGARPTHPELLDWLARELITHEWRLKPIHKLILLSATYQQSSHATAEALDRDRENHLFSRQNRNRLEGEVIRDSLLAISGRLNRQIGGPSVFPPISAAITQTSKNWSASPNAADHARRSLYVFARRNLRFPFLEVFDAPDSNLSCPERGRSTTAPQSLTLLNSEEVLTAAKITGKRLLKEAQSQEKSVVLAFRLILGRPPSLQETSQVREFIQSCLYRPDVTAADQTGMEFAFAELCRALFNRNAFIYLE
jgi:hypothetical protein